jgi:hypothetical protein
VDCVTLSEISAPRERSSATRRICEARRSGILYFCSSEKLCLELVSRQQLQKRWMRASVPRVLQLRFHSIPSLSREGSLFRSSFCPAFELEGCTVSWGTVDTKAFNDQLGQHCGIE